MVVEMRVIRAGREVWQEEEEEEAWEGVSR
jgi:hypothetical protein